MRLLRITNSVGTFDADLDDETAIGFDLQAYDLKQPGKRKINISNQFTIPITGNNLRIFGFPGHIHSISSKPYEKNYCDYWIDNTQLIKDARIRVESVNETRLSLFIFQKNDIWDELKLFKWPEFQREFIAWLQTEKGLETLAAPFTGSWQEFVDYYLNHNNAHGLFLPMTFGNLYTEPDPNNPGYNIEKNDTANPAIYAGYSVGVGLDKLKPGKYCTLVKTIFEFIEYKYSISFFTSGGTFIGNLWSDVVARTIFTTIRDVEIFPAVTTYPAHDFYFFIEPEIIVLKSKFKPHDIINDKADKSLYDFVNSFFQHFNIIMDETDSGIRLYRWDDIESLGPVKDWSGISKIEKFKPNIDGYTQNNYIKFKEIYPDGDPAIKQRNITSDNLNSDAETNLFDIDAYVNAVIPVQDGNVIPDLTVSESFKTFQFFVPDPVNTLTNFVNIYFRHQPATELYAFGYPIIPVQYSLDSEYTLMESAMQKPKYYEVEKWLTLKDIIGLKFFKLYYFQELGASFFLNKIKGFNPSKSKSATTLELFKISDRVPMAITNLDYFTDGFDDEFMDGDGDYFY